MHPGGPPSQAPGHVEDMIRWDKADQVGEHAIRITFMPYKTYWERYIGVYLNGVLREVVFAHAWQPTVVVLMLEPHETKAYYYLEDFGDWPGFAADDEPNEMALTREEEQAARS